MSECQIYTGKIGQAAKKNLGARVIYDLTKDLEEKQHYVYFDSYFTHMAFVKVLKDKGIHVSGTEERERVGMPKKFVSVRHMRRGNSDDRSTNSAIMATLWNSRKGILFLSSSHDLTNVSSVTRKKRDGTSEDLCTKLTYCNIYIK